MGGYIWSGMQKLEVTFCLLEKTVKESNMKMLLLFTVQGHGFTVADCCSGACWEVERHGGEQAMESRKLLSSWRRGVRRARVPRDPS